MLNGQVFCAFMGCFMFLRKIFLIISGISCSFLDVSQMCHKLFHKCFQAFPGCFLLRLHHLGQMFHGQLIMISTIPVLSVTISENQNYIDVIFKYKKYKKYHKLLLYISLQNIITISTQNKNPLHLYRILLHFLSFLTSFNILVSRCSQVYTTLTENHCVSAAISGEF